MTTLYKERVCCSICGIEEEQTGIGSTNAFGSPDLDTRPPEMQRSTIHIWVQRCSGCGACARDLSKIDASAGDVIKNSDYSAQLKDLQFPELANSFICKSIIDEHAGDFKSATWALIYAAWVCDDTGSAAQSITCRRRAATMLRKAEANGQEVTKQPRASTAILIDLLRRADAFDEAVEVIGKTEGTASGDVIAQVIRYQKRLIEAGGRDCHTIAEALRDGNHPRPGSSGVDRGSAVVEK